MYAIFNKKTKEFIGFSPNEAITMGNVLYKDIGPKIDVGLYRWHGDYDSGSLVAKSSVNYLIDEYKLEKKLFSKVTRKYPIITQLKIIIDQLNTTFIEDQQTEEFKELHRYLTLLHDNHTKRVDHFRNSEDHEFHSKDDIDKSLDRAFEI